jgi:isochorismate pyruvate lyase
VELAAEAPIAALTAALWHIEGATRFHQFVSMTNSNVPELDSARAEIDTIDEALVKLLAERQRVVERVVAIKRSHKLPSLIPQRVQDVIERAELSASRQGLSPDLAQRLWTVMVAWFVEFEDQQLGSG